MRIRSRKKLSKKTLLVSILLLLPLSYPIYIGVQMGQIYEEVLAFQYGIPPDSSTFMNTDYDKLAAMAEVYDDLYERNHMPLNFTGSVVYKDTNCTEVSYYSFSDNCALWTGIAMAGWVFRYQTALKENTSDVDYCLDVIKRMVNGMAMMVIVPNGGLGPEYGGILARGWAGPQHKSIASMYFQENIRHFNGTGAYSNYRWRGYTSNDEYGGYYMGLGLALKYVNDTYVQSTVSQVVDQVANYMVDTNFLGISGPGGPSGVDQKAKLGSGGIWVSTLLKMASMCYPEKYNDLYYQYVASEMYYLSSSEGGDHETIANYYAYNFAHCVVFAFLLLEGIDSEIGKVYYQYYLNSLRKFTEFHRNAWFNVIFLALSAKKGDYPTIEHDIEDQLMRLEINHFPDRAYKLKSVPSNFTEVESIEEWKNFMENHSWGSTMEIGFIESNLDEVYLTQPLTVEYRPTDNYMWQRNPFTNQTGGWSYSRYENPGTTFTVPYWIGRAFGFISASGTRVTIKK
jgi:hypothetical protein